MALCTAHQLGALCASGSVYIRREGAGPSRAGDWPRVSDAASRLVDKHGSSGMGRLRLAELARASGDLGTLSQSRSPGGCPQRESRARSPL